MSNELKTEEYVVAFIDLLGASELIKSDPDNSLKTIHNCYKNAVAMAKSVKPFKINYKISIFSDNILIGIKVTRNVDLATAAYCITMFALSFQHILLYNGILSRGGIAKGGFFKDSTMVWGDALTRAYELENKLAIYPRVILDPALSDLLNEPLPDEEKLSHYYIKDSDGFYFADCFNIYDEMRLSYSNVINRLITDREKYSGKDRVTQKYDWLISFAKRKMEAYERQ